MHNSSFVVRWGLFVLLFFVGPFSFAQPAVQAGKFMAEKNYDKAIPLYEEVYAKSPDSVYTDYLHALILAKKYKQAEKVAGDQIKRYPQNPFLHIDLGLVYDAAGKEAKAKEQYEGLVQMINGDDMLTQRIVKAFIDAGKDNYAILTYEHALQLLGGAFLYVYSGSLAKLYARTGHLDKAVEVLLTNNQGQFVNVENAKNLLLEIVGNDSVKLEQTQKILIKKINEHPENINYAEVLTWIYTQKKDWDGALIQIEAIDERNNEDGSRLMNLARQAINARQYDVAGRAYDDIIAKGPGVPAYTLARSEKLNTALAKIKNSPAFTIAEVDSVARLYDSFLVAYPQYYALQPASDFAMLEAVYGNNTNHAIEILKKGLASPDIRRSMVGQLKMQLGDYYVLTGRIWEASLTYSQVDKDFVQDALGEEARFRNAKLAYYRGDFDWAQRQLTRLKSATSELIANDAIYLSVLITENVEDTVIVPLQRFAYAGLLLFQNKDKETEMLLDSLTTAFPKHPLNDDIIMMRADIAIKHHDYPKALGYLKTIYEQYGKDVLGDDAVYKMAEIYRENLHQPDQAKHYYEQLIIDYPGSTFVQSARQKLSELNNGTANP